MNAKANQTRTPVQRGTKSTTSFTVGGEQGVELHDQILQGTLVSSWLFGAHVSNSKKGGMHQSLQREERLSIKKSQGGPRMQREDFKKLTPIRRN